MKQSDSALDGERARARARARGVCAPRAVASRAPVLGQLIARIHLTGGIARPRMQSASGRWLLGLVGLRAETAAVAHTLTLWSARLELVARVARVGAGLDLQLVGVALLAAVLHRRVRREAVAPTRAPALLGGSLVHLHRARLRQQERAVVGADMLAVGQLSRALLAIAFIVLALNEPHIATLEALLERHRIRASTGVTARARPAQRVVVSGRVARAEAAAACVVRMYKRPARAAERAGLRTRPRRRQVRYVLISTRGGPALTVPMRGQWQWGGLALAAEQAVRCARQRIRSLAQMAAVGRARRHRRRRRRRVRALLLAKSGARVRLKARDGRAAAVAPLVLLAAAAAAGELALVFEHRIAARVVEHLERAVALALALGLRARRQMHLHLSSSRHWPTGHLAVVRAE